MLFHGLPQRWYLCPPGARRMQIRRPVFCLLHPGDRRVLQRCDGIVQVRCVAIDPRPACFRIHVSRALYTCTCSTTSCALMAHNVTPCVGGWQFVHPGTPATCNKGCAQQLLPMYRLCAQAPDGLLRTRQAEFSGVSQQLARVVGQCPLVEEGVHVRSVRRRRLAGQGTCVCAAGYGGAYCDDVVKE
jgi:hypothetical protein